MGQNVSSQVQEFFPAVFEDLWKEDCPNTLLSSEIRNLSYEDFLKYIGKLNSMSKNYSDENGRHLIFAVKQNSDSTVFWKATVQIACIKIDSDFHKVDSFRLLSLPEFMKVFKTLNCQYMTAEQSQQGQHTNVPISCRNSKDTNESNSSNLEGQTECCICLERVPEMLLPCTHSYCSKCIEEWSVMHDTCPICREKLKSCEDTWVLSEIPKAEEISEEIRSNLMSLTEERPASCVSS